MEIKNYTILSADDAKTYTTKNREKPINSILSMIEDKIVAAIKYRADAIIWRFEGEDVLFMHEVLNELRNCGYTVKDTDEYEDASTFSVRISWM